MNKAKTSSKAKISKTFHPRNVHNAGYDFADLIRIFPKLTPYVSLNKYNNQSIDFADPAAVKMLNTALLARYYDIVAWDIPDGYLCPPIPGRVDYIHYIADLLQAKNKPNTTLLDIGTGANGIYALLSSQIYGWQCVASDIDADSLANVRTILEHNQVLNDRITLRHQANKDQVFDGIIKPGDYYDVTVCNPPFHASLEEALAGNQTKRQNLALNRHQKRAKSTASPLNFGGQKAELWCEGGESRFLRLMINESKQFAEQCHWFTSLVSKSDNLKLLKKRLAKVEATEVKVIEMKQGNKITRILAWTFKT